MPELLTCPAGGLRLSTVLQVAELESTTGVLALGQVGEVHLRDGVPTAARYGAHEGVDALLEFFLDPPGEMRLVATEVAPGPVLGNPVGLVMEGCRLADEWARLAPLVLAVVRPDELSPEQEPELAPFAGLMRRAYTPVGAAGTGGDPAGAAHRSDHATVCERCAAGGGGADASACPGRTARVGRAAGPDTWLSLGRRLARAERYDEAVVAFINAVRLDPDSRVAKQNLARASALASQLGAR